MTKSTKVTSTGVTGWQETSQAWAEGGEHFEVHRMGAKHLAFCKELCVKYNYECNHEDSIAVFVPMSF
jgi:hypothetical protein